MAYQNPYEFRTNAGHYRDDSIPYNPYTQYTDNQPVVNRAFTENQPAVNHYTDNQPEVYYPPIQRAPTSSSVPVTVSPLRRESSGFELGEFAPAAMPPDSK